VICVLPGARPTGWSGDPPARTGRDCRVGWAIGTGAVLATPDGGAHWAALPEPCPPIRSVHFVSPGIGFAVARR
jgi:photosystem II stability/assembly factor-like uncharacterized protein